VFIFAFFTVFSFTLLEISAFILDNNVFLVVILEKSSSDVIKFLLQ
jgi:hypothetical protein